MQKPRKIIIKGVFGETKTYHGMARSKFREISEVEIQFLLTAIALNLKRIIKILRIKEIESRLHGKILKIIQIANIIFRKFTLKHTILVSKATDLKCYILWADNIHSKILNPIGLAPNIHMLSPSLILHFLNNDKKLIEAPLKKLV